MLPQDFAWFESQIKNRGDPNRNRQAAFVRVVFWRSVSSAAISMASCGFARRICRMRNMMPRCIDVLISQASRRSRSATVVVFLPLAERGRELAYEAAARPFRTKHRWSLRVS